jgi:hypothetical protein
MSEYTGSYFHLAQKQRNVYIFFCELSEMNGELGVKLVRPTQTQCGSEFDASAANTS